MFDLLFPTVCINCGKSGDYLCTVCKKKLKNNLPECYQCRRISNQYKTHKKCNKYRIDNVFVGWKYDSITKKILSQYKYKYAYKLSKILADLLIKQIKSTRFIDTIQENSLLLPVPIHQEHTKERGFNQSQLITNYLSKNLGLEIIDKAIIRTGKNIYQSQRTAHDRRNLQDVFTKSINIKDKNIIIVDDVITTGTTLNRIAEVLKGNKLKAIVLFRGRPHFHQQKE
jgi:competence protein ComFC